SSHFQLSQLLFFHFRFNLEGKYAFGCNSLHTGKQLLLPKTIVKITTKMFAFHIISGSLSSIVKCTLFGTYRQRGGCVLRWGVVSCLNALQSSCPDRTGNLLNQQPQLFLLRW